MERAIAGLPVELSPPDARLGPGGGAATRADFDASLLQLALAGDAAAFQVLVERNERPIVGYLLGMLGNREEALDAAQEVFVRVFVKAETFQPGSAFRSWLYRIATNVALDALRRRRRGRWLMPLASKPTGDGSEGVVHDVADASGRGALETLLDDEAARAVRAAVATLPPRYRSALVLRDLQDMSYEEIAAALSCRVGTVKSRVNRARTLLRTKLAAHFGGGRGRSDA